MVSAGTFQMNSGQEWPQNGHRLAKGGRKVVDRFTEKMYSMAMDWPESLLWKPSDMALFMGSSEDTVYRWCRSMAIPWHQIGERITRIHRDTVRDMAGRSLIRCVECSCLERELTLPPLITVGEFRRHLQVSRATAYRLLSRHYVASLKDDPHVQLSLSVVRVSVPGRTWIPAGSLLDYIDAVKIEPSQHLTMEVLGYE